MHFVVLMLNAGWFGPFQLVRLIGAGELGEVFFARTPWNTTRCAALKCFRADRSASASFSERFRRSMRVTKAIDHANVVPLFDSGAIDGVLYTCSQLVPGRDVMAVSDRLANRGLGAPAAVGLRILMDVLSGLMRIQHLLSHGALGPRNVIVGWDGIARISDLGVPRAQDIQDLRAVGLSLHRLYTTYDAGSISDLRPDLPDWLCSLVRDLVQGTGQVDEIFASVIDRAGSEGLIIPHSAVATWIGELFPIERSIELSEIVSPTAVRREAPGFLDEGRLPRGWVRPPSKTEPEVTAWDTRTRYARPRQKISGGVAC